jgi:wee1-like protein kinase
VGYYGLIIVTVQICSWKIGPTFFTSLESIFLLSFMCILVQILKMHLLKLKICKGLDFIHERGVAHLDVKPDNIYIRNSVYKLGDFGCATLIDRSLAIEDGDSRYMPPEMLNDKHENLDKVDIFCLGAAIYELIRGTPLPVSGPYFASIREGRITLLPGCPMQFQSLIKV